MANPTKIFLEDGDEPSNSDSFAVLPGKTAGSGEIFQKAHCNFPRNRVYWKQSRKEGPLMKIASFILKIAAMGLAAAAVVCAATACLCASLQDAE